MPPPPQLLTSPAWCFSSCIPSVTLWLIRKTPIPILPLTCLRALFISILKVTLGLLGLSAVWSGVGMGGIINLYTPWSQTPRVLCMQAGLWEWVHPVPSRQGIYSLNFQSLSVVGGHNNNGLGLSPSLSPSCFLSHLSDRCVSMRNKQPRL